MKRFEPVVLDPNDYKEEVELAEKARELLKEKKYFKVFGVFIKVLFKSIFENHKD